MLFVQILQSSDAHSTACELLFTSVPGCVSDQSPYHLWKCFIDAMLSRAKPLDLDTQCASKCTPYILVGTNLAHCSTTMLWIFCTVFFMWDSTLLMKQYMDL